LTVFQSIDQYTIPIPGKKSRHTRRFIYITPRKGDTRGHLGCLIEQTYRLLISDLGMDPTFSGKRRHSSDWQASNVCFSWINDR